MAAILSIETSTSVCSAALHENGKLIAVKELHTPQSAASQLVVQIDQLFSTTGTSKSHLAAVAVSSGPGSYTGLRIGIASAKGICFGLHLPLIAIDSLQILAHAVNPLTTDLLCPMIDARRMEVYCCLLDASFNIIEKTQARVIDEKSFADRLISDTILFFGDGAMKCRSVITHRNAHFLENIYPSASNLGPLAFEKFKLGQFVDLASFEPDYLKEFKAKTKMA